MSHVLGALLQLTAWRDVFIMPWQGTQLWLQVIMCVSTHSIKNIRHVTKIVYFDYYALNIEYRHYLCSANNQRCVLPRLILLDPLSELDSFALIPL